MPPLQKEGPKNVYVTPTDTCRLIPDYLISNDGVGKGRGI